MSAQQNPSRPSSDRRTSAIQKRTSLLPKPSSVVLDPSVLIAQHAQLTGTQPITVGPYAVLHPHSKVSSALAPVVLGEGAILHERAKVGVGLGSEGDAGGRTRPSSVAGRGSMGAGMRGEGTVLGRYVVVEATAVVEANEVGEGSVVGVGAIVGRGCVLGRFCTISPAEVIPPNTHLPDFTVVYGGGQRRVDRTLRDRKEMQDMKMAIHTKQLDAFRKLVPNNIAKWA